MDLSNYFDRVVVINLKRRPDRLEQFLSELERFRWPFRKPDVFHAIDGTKVPAPKGWDAGGGAWGCMQSHRQILESAIQDDVDKLLVLEDDMCLNSDFVERVSDFLDRVPSDWGQLMLGGQHSGNTSPRRIKNGIVRCCNCQRTHAYAVRGRFMRALYQHWVSTQGHCDHRMGEIQARYRVYSPAPFIFGQSEGKSDISGATNPRKFWVPPKKCLPVVLLDAPKDVVGELRSIGFHTGNDRHDETELDNGLNAIVNGEKGPLVEALTEWVQAINWEVTSNERGVCTIWHPGISLAQARQATDGIVYEIQANSVSQAIARAPDTIRERIGMVPSENQGVQFPSDIIVLLTTSRQVAEELRRHGWHSGYFVDEATGIDRGLIDIFENGNPEDHGERLAYWIEELSKEADQIQNGIVVVRHPDATRDVLQQATSKCVVEINARTAEEALQQFQEATTAAAH